MAARFLCPHRQVFIFPGHNLKTFSQFLRVFSSQGSNDRKKITEQPHTTAEPVNNWLDICAGIFGPSDDRLPLPGDVGLGHELDKPLPDQQMKIGFIRMTKSSIELLSTHCGPLELLEQKKAQSQGNTSSEEFYIDSLMKDSRMPEEVLEYHLQECPELLKKDFQSLFPDRDLRSQKLTVITLSQKTKHDMSCWSEKMEEEREELMALFVQAANSVCMILRKEGFWSDFIDPGCGRPYLGSFTNSTLFETDERYRHFGFTIEDLGCCKVISHHSWGTNVFVGAVFTNAPVCSEVLDEALADFRKKGCEVS